MSTPLTIPLNTPEAIEDWKASIVQAENFDDGKDAEEYVRFYESFLKSNPTFGTEYPDYAPIYEDLYSRALWLALPYANERDGLVLFESRLAVPLANTEYNLWEKTRQWLTNIPLAKRDEVKKKLLEIIMHSSAEATKSALREGETSVPGTVAQWARHYQGLVGIDAPDHLAQSQYFFSNRTFTAIPPAERETLKRLFTLVDRLKRSSKDPDGFEEDIVIEDEGKFISIFEGEELELSPEAREILQKIRRMGSPEDRQAKLVSLLRGSDAEVDVVKKYEAEYSQRLEDKEDKIREELYIASTPVSGKRIEPEKIVALLKLLARKNALENILRSDKRFFDLLVAAYQKSGLFRKIDDLKVYPTSPSHIATFLQVLLGERVGVRMGDVARAAVQLANIMKKQGKEEYMDMAFFDEDAEQFVFSEPMKQTAIIGGGL